MFRITKQSASDRIVLKLEGRFSAACASELDTCWRDAAIDASAPIWLDLSDVWWVDRAGQAQLARMHRAGVHFVARGCALPELLREITESY